MNRFSRFAIPFGFALALAQPALTETLKKPDLDRLVADQRVATAPEFRAFLVESARANPKVAQSVAAYQSKAALTGDDLVNIGRLLGLYNRLQNQKAVIATIEQMVAIPTVRVDKTPPHENKDIIAFGVLVEAIAKDFTLEYHNVDNRIFEVKLPGRGKDEFGILTHADVVPVVPEEWVLADGTRLDPFKVTRVGDYLYGRGTIDDKGSIAAVLYAMKVVKESGVPLDRTIRLMIETTEETGGDAMKYYRSKSPLPEYNIVLDSKYPAVVAEKGSGALRVLFPRETSDRSTTAVHAMAGAAAANAVPQTATARLEGGQLTAIASKLDATKAAFVEKYESRGGKFTIDVVKGPERVEVKVTGASAHGSRPEEGVNPLPRLTLFLQESGIPLANNHYAKAIKYLNDLYGTGYLGEQMNVAYADDFMGPLTMSPNLIRERDGTLEVTTNVRMPRGNTPEALNKAVTGKIDAWAVTKQIRVKVDYHQGDWMARDPKGA